MAGGRQMKIILYVKTISGTEFHKACKQAEVEMAKDVMKDTRLFVPAKRAFSPTTRAWIKTKLFTLPTMFTIYGVAESWSTARPAKVLCISPAWACAIKRVRSSSKQTAILFSQRICTQRHNRTGWKRHTHKTPKSGLVTQKGR